jgi:type I restriction enzyme S subunit
MNFDASWQKLSLKNAGITLIDCDHRTPPAADTGYPYIAIPQIKNGHIQLDGVRKISPEHYAEWTRKLKPQANDVIVVRRCNSGDSALIPHGLECAIGQNLVVLRSDGKHVMPEFLRWLVSGPDWWEQVRKFINVGAVFDSLKCREIPHFELTIPPIEAQCQITVLLGALDDRITLLRETNATLEAIAQAMFKSWFVDFDPVHAKQQGRVPEGMDEATAALFPDSFEESELGLVPKGWRVGVLGDFLSLRNERTKPSDFTASLPYVPVESISAKSPFLQEYKSGEDANSSLILFHKGDVLFGAMRPYFHKVCSAPFNGVTRTTVFTLTSKNTMAAAFSLFQAYQDTTIEYATQHSEGSTIPYAKWGGSLENMPVVVPSKEMQERYSEVVSEFIERANGNLRQAQTLATLRDTLLPRLISGQLHLPESEAQLEEAAA